jgi:putative ABC transport system ATP-binding protein
VSNPPIILADEPTGNLDTRSGAEIMRILKELHSNGNTIILITHDNDIASQAMRMVRIQDGEIIEDKEVV